MMICNSQSWFATASPMPWWWSCFAKTKFSPVWLLFAITPLRIPRKTLILTSDQKCSSSCTQWSILSIFWVSRDHFLELPSFGSRFLWGSPCYGAIWIATPRCWFSLQSDATARFWLGYHALDFYCKPMLGHVFDCDPMVSILIAAPCYDPVSNATPLHQS